MYVYIHRVSVFELNNISVYLKEIKIRKERYFIFISVFDVLTTIHTRFTPPYESIFREHYVSYFY